MQPVTMPFSAAPRRARGPGCLPDLLREQVRFRPDDVAVVAGEDALTFAALARESGRLAARLRRLGVQPDGCVGIHAEPSIELMIGVWGVLCAGGAYLPLSPDYPDDRLRYMIADSGTRVVVCQEHLAARLRSLATPGTRVVSPRDGIDAPRGLVATPRPENLAYVIYTSGSTGRPKGVMIEHRSVVNQLSWLRSAHALSRARTVLQKTPMSFDAAQWEILATGCGSRVVMAGPGAHRDPRRIVAAIKAHDVTTLQCVPTLLQALLDSDDLHTCTSLEQVFSGGEALTCKLARRCVEALPWCELVNLYGPAECTINATSFTVDRRALKHASGSVSIGRPVRGTQLYVLDERLAPAAPGEIGELCIGGVQLARGYLGRDDLTAERFVPNPFSAGDEHPRLYRSGDLGWRDADGTVQFAGRADNQVKLRGCRVELDEIGVAIETHDWVTRAAVIARTDDRTGAQSLVAFVELDPREAALMDQGAGRASPLQGGQGPGQGPAVQRGLSQRRGDRRQGGRRPARQAAGRRPAPGGLRAQDVSLLRGRPGRPIRSPAAARHDGRGRASPRRRHA